MVGFFLPNIFRSKSHPKIDPLIASSRQVPKCPLVAQVSRVFGRSNELVFLPSGLGAPYQDLVGCQAVNLVTAG